MRKARVFLTLGALLAVTVLVAGPAGAGSNLPISAPSGASPIHPQFPLLDADGNNVLDSGGPVSPMVTCGQCHDTAFIEQHDYHAQQGFDRMTSPGQAPSGRPWDTSPGLFGEWNPITYRYLTPKGDERLDLGTADWIRYLGFRHPGGGPAVTSQEGVPLTALVPSDTDPETHVLDPETGEPTTWDWNASGVEELNCFLCHTSQPNNEARIRELKAGNFQWASTATLDGTGVVFQLTDGEWQWKKEAFDDNGNLSRRFVTIQDPSSENCGQCHGTVHESDRPLDTIGATTASWETLTTGQVFSPQRISESALNIAGKDALNRAWDIHAERQVECTQCHPSVNNPIYLETVKPSYLNFDVRRADFGDYFTRPSHIFAKGRSAQGTLAPQFDYTMRDCDSCHDVEAAHDWLPYVDRHMQKLTCETCHIPKMYEPAAEQYDWTVVHLDGTPKTIERGIDGPVDDAASLITGYEPVVLKQEGKDGDVKLAPYNLVSSWYWVYGDPARPVRQIDLEAAFIDNGAYRPEIVAAFDSNGDGSISDTELAIDSVAKEQAVETQLEALGLTDVRIQAEIQPYTIAHGVTGAGWATQECETCHSPDSRLTTPMQLAAYVPGGVMPSFVPDTNTETAGDITVAEDGSLWYQPTTAKAGVGVLGSDSGGWVDWVGWTLFILTFLGIAIHGGIRFLLGRKLRQSRPELVMEYMYEPYERFWHWLQAIAIIGLVVTGAIIHYPGSLAAGGGFRATVIIHNILAVILVANALLSIVWHVASGAIRQYIPRPRGFFDQAITQAMYYMRGIFQGEPHPFEKDPRHKLNPLQQATYVVILNILLPLQMITGILIWGAQKWPQVTASLGGLPFLLPVHTIGAWLFAAFVVLHVYLTTTGATPLAAIRAMISGWEPVEAHELGRETV